MIALTIGIILIGVSGALAAYAAYDLLHEHDEEPHWPHDSWTNHNPYLDPHILAHPRPPLFDWNKQCPDLKEPPHDNSP
jgi:hypothetical protein